jgi:hypothetical protein
LRWRISKLVGGIEECLGLWVVAEHARVEVINNLACLWRHDWGSRFDEQPTEEILERMSEMAPREMRRAWMTAFGNAKLAHRARVGSIDLPDAHQRRTPMGFVH